MLWLASSTHNPTSTWKLKAPKLNPMKIKRCQLRRPWCANKPPHFMVCSPFWGCALRRVIGPVFCCMPVLHSWCLSVVLIGGLADRWHLLRWHHAALVILLVQVIYVLSSIVIMVESVIAGYPTPSSHSLHHGGIPYCCIWLSWPCWGFPPWRFGLRVVVVEHTTER